MFGAEKSPFAVAVKAAAEEARLRGDRRIGTEHLLLGLLTAAESTGARTPGADVLGVDLAAARAALAELDAAALRAIGLDVGQAPQARPRKHPAVPATALTTSARAAVNQAIKTTSRKDRNTQANTQLLLALLAHKRPDPVADLLDHLGVDRAVSRARIESRHR
ncbi:Clp protease N-terminal domain-containing protein [Allokutzneria albata]|uniref:Clp amino terminal domain-containing protein, pathogenicity island component n=1 Tax=Allokutzneria albata TaxID=211114 RepID=A0A1G9VNB0_ALLAB|nr:Clp protease N-terminal domain-containing protein [Allokutzneria albata]SDM73590.1 Clp amino terminal domain-containing protein, pathogenicity island component [Allokutzneria albata]